MESKTAPARPSSVLVGSDRSPRCLASPLSCRCRCGAAKACRRFSPSEQQNSAARPAAATRERKGAAGGPPRAGGRRSWQMSWQMSSKISSSGVFGGVACGPSSCSGWTT